MHHVLNFHAVIDTPPPPDTVGSCMDAGYQNCCIAGYCAGSPPTCDCDSNCYQRETCCPDINVTCPRGSCEAAGYRACCTDESSCQATGGCYCDHECTFYGDCCFDFVDLCPSTPIGSCIAAGYTTCCDDGSECFGSPPNCKCDAECRDHGDCCTDIALTCHDGKVTTTCITESFQGINLFANYLNSAFLRVKFSRVATLYKFL